MTDRMARRMQLAKVGAKAGGAMAARPGAVGGRHPEPGGELRADAELRSAEAVAEAWAT
ncbi:MAG: hypothetical protein R2704_03240 [Microthrixaceae bacterium]